MTTKLYNRFILFGRSDTEDSFSNASKMANKKVEPFRIKTIFSILDASDIIHQYLHLLNSAEYL